MDDIDKLNFINLALQKKPDLIDKVFNTLSQELPEYNNSYAHKLVTKLKERTANLNNGFNASNTEAPGEYLLEAISNACFYRTVVPEWAALAFWEALFRYRMYEFKTFSDAFRLEKRRNFEQRRKTCLLRSRTVAVVNMLCNEAWKRDPSGFQRLGDELGVSSSTARNLYYSVRGKVKKTK